MEFTNVRSTPTKEAENQASITQTYKPVRSKKSVETQVQTDILPRPGAQTNIYNILLSKENDERIQMNRQEKGTLATYRSEMPLHNSQSSPMDMTDYER